MEAVKKCLLEQREEVGSRLREEGLAARTIQVKLRYADFTTLTRSRTLPTPTQDEMAIYHVGGYLLAAIPIAGRRIRLIGIGGANLVKPEAQPELFDQNTQKRERLAKAVDELRGKLGPGAIKRGTALS